MDTYLGAGHYYFGLFLAQQEYQARVEAMTVDAILDTAEMDLHFLLDIARDVQAVVSERGLPLITYEAGYHMVRATDVPFPSALVEEKLTAVTRHPRMYDLYTVLLTGWSEIGGTMNLYNDTMPFGNFGLIDR